MSIHFLVGEQALARFEVVEPLLPQADVVLVSAPMALPEFVTRRACYRWVLEVSPYLASHCELDAQGVAKLVIGHEKWVNW
jgi:hypothetical protein